MGVRGLVRVAALLAGLTLLVFHACAGGAAMQEAYTISGPQRVAAGVTYAYTATSTDVAQRIQVRACGSWRGSPATGGLLTVDVLIDDLCSPNLVVAASETPLDSGTYVDRASLTLAVKPAGRGATGTDGPPQQVHWRDRLCYGFPGCPDSFLFMVPALVAMMTMTRTRHIAWLGGVFSLAFVVTAVVLDVNTLRVIIYIVVAVSVGLIWFSFRRK